jgi:hypothetical protein
MDRPPCSKAREMPNTGTPAAKLLVPSRGIQTPEHIRLLQQAGLFGMAHFFAKQGNIGVTGGEHVPQKILAINIGAGDNAAIGFTAGADGVKTG